MNTSATICGRYSSGTAFLAIAGYGLVQLLQVAGLISYPWDARLIYGFSLAIAPPFLLAMLAFHYVVPADRRFWSHGALLFAVLYSMYVILMYVVQLATVIPASLLDPNETLLTVKPHSLFWTIDALGYICMGIATFLAAFALKANGEHQWLRRFFLANGWVVLPISVVYFYPDFSVGLLFLGLPWLITAAGSTFLMSRFFKNKPVE